MSKFWKQEQSSDTEEETDCEKETDRIDVSDGQKRVVCSVKDKMLNEFLATANQIINVKETDWVVHQESFVKLNKLLEKVMMVTKSDKPPNIYIKALVTLENFLNIGLANNQWKLLEGIKKKAFRSIKKKMKVNSRLYRDLIDKCREKPQDFEENFQEEGPEKIEQEPVEDDAGKVVKKERKKKRKIKIECGRTKVVQISCAKFVNSMKQHLRKRNKLIGYQYANRINVPEPFEEEIEPFDEEIDEEFPYIFYAKESDDKLDAVAETTPGWERMINEIDENIGNQFRDPSQITWDKVNNKFKEILAARGKKGTGRIKLVQQLTYLTRVAKTPAQKLEILFSVVSAQFDAYPSLSSHMPIDEWKQCVKNMLAIIDLLMQHPNIVVDDMVEPDENHTQWGADHNGTIRIRGNLVDFLQMVDTEYIKSLQDIDPQTNGYVERMKDEPMFLVLAQVVQEYLEKVGDYKSAAKVALKRVEHVYYKTQMVYDAMRKLVEKEIEEEKAVEEIRVPPASIIIPRLVPRKPTFPENIHTMMDKLVPFIYEYGDERVKARAMLCVVFQYCILDKFLTSRDLLLGSHLHDDVQHMDVSTQILFNRAMAQLGLCAFRAGLFPEGHSCLSELYSTGRVKEVLGQGFSQGRYPMETQEELLERRRWMPYHMHLNLDMLEAAYLICAMILEVPNMAAKRKVISKTFRSLLEASDQQIVTGPPQMVRDHIMAATGFLRQADWAKAFSIITSLKCCRFKDDVVETIKAKIKEVALRAYVSTFHSAYDSISIAHLSKTFYLSDPQTSSILRKMIMDEELQASLDQQTEFIVFHSTIEHTKLQALAFRLIEKLSVLAESNERLMETRFGDGEAILGKGTWNLMLPDPSQKVISSKSIFKAKLKSDCTLDKLKARIVARGVAEMAGVDFETIVELSTFKGHPSSLEGVQPAVKDALTRDYNKGISSCVIKSADLITLPGIKKVPKKRVAAMLEPVDEPLAENAENEDENLSDAEDQEDDAADPEKKQLQSDLQSLNSKAIHVQIDLKGSASSSGKKAPAGRGKGSADGKGGKSRRGAGRGSGSAASKRKR